MLARRQRLRGACNGTELGSRCSAVNQKTQAMDFFGPSFVLKAGLTIASVTALNVLDKTDPEVIFWLRGPCCDRTLLPASFAYMCACWALQWFGLPAPAWR